MKKENQDLETEVRNFYYPKIRKDMVVFSVILATGFVAIVIWNSDLYVLLGMITSVVFVLIDFFRNTNEQDDWIYNYNGTDTLHGLFSRPVSMDQRRSIMKLVQDIPKLKKTRFAKNCLKF